MLLNPELCPLPEPVIHDEVLDQTMAAMGQSICTAVVQNDFLMCSGWFIMVLVLVVHLCSMNHSFCDRCADKQMQGMICLLRNATWL